MSLDTRQIERDVEAAVGADTASIAERVRAITLAALTEGRLDSQALRGVMNAVLEGAQRGSMPIDTARTAAFKEAMSGLDQALASAAQATQLAMQEAIGRSAEFSREGLRQALEPFSSIENDFIGALSEAARKTSGEARATLTELAEHMRHSGTAAGARVRDAAGDLARASSSLALSQVEGGMKTLLNQADLLASLAAGVLRGFADRLHAGNSAADAPTPATREGDDAPH